MTPDEEQQLLAVVAALVPATAAQVGRALGQLSNRLHELTDELAEADAEATEVSEAYELAYDKAFLAAGEGERVAVEVRKAIARVETYEARLAAEVCKARVRSLRAAHRTLDRRIDVGRTQAATVRSEHRNIGYGQAS